MMELRHVSTLQPAAYNPREADEERLRLVHLSLRKLGWLLPIYAAGSEILSGHQRHLVASERWGATRVPVEDLGEDRSGRDRRLINIAFNRGTNDLLASDSSQTLTAEIRDLDLEAMASEFPDLDPDGPEAWPCLRVRSVPLEPLIASCRGRWSPHAKWLASMLADRGVHMPVIVAGDRVINGVGRVQLAAERHEFTIPAVEIEAEKAELASALLNRLTMDFAIHKRYADLLRYSNSRRGRDLSKLNRGMLYALGILSKDFDPGSRAHVTKWRRYYGSTVLDFGAGLGADTEILRSMGVDSVPFEPWAYPTERGEDLDVIDADVSRARAREFLARVPETRFDSVFLCSVFNSVPFDADRRFLVTLIAALSEMPTRVYPCAAAYSHPNARHAAGAGYNCGYFRQRDGLFPLCYEPRTLMTSFADSAKTQRYFTPAEFYDLWHERFRQVRVNAEGSIVRGWIRDPRPLPWDELEAAIRFEFDLPYPDGSRMGLVDEALAAFESRRSNFG